MIVDNHASLFREIRENVYMRVSGRSWNRIPTDYIARSASEKRKNIRATIYRGYAVTRIEKL